MSTEEGFEPFFLVAKQSCDSGVEAGPCPLPEDMTVHNKAQEVTLSPVPVIGMALPHPQPCYLLLHCPSCCSAAEAAAAALLWASLGSDSPKFL